MIDPTEAHEVGDEITYQGQRFYLMGIERRPGARPCEPPMRVEIWQSTCFCGEPFLIETERYRKLREPNRRCPKHRAPVRRVVFEAT